MIRATGLVVVVFAATVLWMEYETLACVAKAYWRRKS